MLGRGFGEKHCPAVTQWEAAFGQDPLWLVEHQCLTTAWDAARMKLLGNHRQNQESVGQCGLCQPAPLHPLFLQGGDEEQPQGPVSQLSHQLQAQEASMATSPQQLRDCQRSSSCRWGWKEQVGVPACDPGGNSPEWVPALMLLETWMNSGSAHLKGTSPCPRREDMLGLRPVGQEVVPCLPDCSQTSSCALLLCLS